MRIKETHELVILYDRISICVLKQTQNINEIYHVLVQKLKNTVLLLLREIIEGATVVKQY